MLAQSCGSAVGGGTALTGGPSRTAAKLEAFGERLLWGEVTQWCTDTRFPLELEIGCNTGDFLMSRAGRSPQIRLVGIELRRDLCHVARSRVLRRELRNVRVLNGDAADVITHLIPSSCISGFTSTFQLLTSGLSDSAGQLSLDNSSMVAGEF